MKANMQHTKETFQRLARIQYNTYCQGQKLVSLVFSVTMLLLGIMGGFDTGTSLVLIFIGCWAFTGMNVPADRNAKKMIEYAKEDFPCSEYRFEENSICILGDGKETDLSYSDLYSLICDGSYLYLFISKYSAYMVNLELLGEKQAQELKALLSQKTGQQIGKPGSLLSLNLTTLRKTMHKDKTQ